MFTSQQVPHCGFEHKYSWFVPLLSDIHTLKQLLPSEIIHYIAAVPLCAPLNFAHIPIYRECISFKGGTVSKRLVLLLHIQQGPGIDSRSGRTSVEKFYVLSVLA